MASNYSRMKESSAVYAVADAASDDEASSTSIDDGGIARLIGRAGAASPAMRPLERSFSSSRGSSGGVAWGWLCCALSSVVAVLLLLDSPPCSSADGVASARLLCRLLPSLTPALPSLTSDLPSLPLALQPPLLSSPSPIAASFPCSATVLREQLHYLSRSEELELLRDAGYMPAIPLPRLLVVGMTGSQKGRERMRTALDTWVRDIRDRAVFFSDVDDPDLRMVALPSLRERTGYRDAQHRQLRGLRWLLNLTTPHTLFNGSMVPEVVEPYSIDDPDHNAQISDRVAMQLRDEAVRGDVDWVFFADDDTFVNVPALFSLLRDLQQHSRMVPFVMGNVFDRVTGRFDMTYCLGGAGFVMPLVAARMLAAALYTPVCPFMEFNDDTLGLCAMTLNVTAVHNALFQNGMDFSVWRGYFKLGPLKQESVTWHYATDDVARELQTEIDRRKSILSQCTAHVRPQR